MKDLEKKQDQIDELLEEVGYYLDECKSNLNWSIAFTVVMVIAFVSSIFINGGSLLVWCVGLVAFGISQYFSWQATKWRKRIDEPMRQADKLLEEVGKAVLEKFLNKLVDAKIKGKLKIQ